MQQQRIGLLIVDSIAAPYRDEYNENELKQRAKSLRKIGKQLYSIASEYNIPVVCINQVKFHLNPNRNTKSNFFFTITVKWKLRKKRTKN